LSWDGSGSIRQVWAGRQKARRVIGAEFESLLRAAQAGNEAALGRLYRDLNPALVRFLDAQATGSGEDLAQDVWLGAAKGLPSFKGDEQGFRAWMFTIARRRLVSFRRHAERRPQRGTDPAELAEMAAARQPDEELDSRILTDEAVASLVAGLPRDQAEIVLLRVVAGFDADQVGAIVGKRAGTVRVLQHRALRKLAERLGTEAVTK
jgi:RNA polymerase sigma-70 factor, ECF subfamily